MGRGEHRADRAAPMDPDIIDIKHLKADEPWDALSLCNAYRRTTEGQP